MNKHTLKLLLTLSILVPAISYAEELPTVSPIIAVSSFASSTGEEMGTTTEPVVKSFTTCSQEAIEKRDTAIAQSRSAYNIAMNNALTERKNQEKAAVALEDEDEKKDAIKLSVDTYKHQTKAAQNTLTQARKVIWQNFENDIKKCREIEDATVSQVNASSSEEVGGARVMNMTAVSMKKGAAPQEEPEPKTLKEAIKAQLENLKSLFN